MMPMEALAETNSESNSLGVAMLNSTEQKLNEQGAMLEEKAFVEGDLQLTQQDVESTTEESDVDHFSQVAADNDTVVEVVFVSSLSSDEDDVRVYGTLTYVVNPDGTNCTITDCDEKVTGKEGGHLMGDQGYCGTV